MIPRLGVNIDHVATLRQARGEDYPSTVDAATVCLAEGADQITIHLREDRRHIQDTDVEAVQLVTKRFGRPLNLEMGMDQGILEIACTVAPDWVCLVPENRQERTTEGGLNLISPEVFANVEKTCTRLRSASPQTKISLFLQSDAAILEQASKLRHLVHAVEIHTGDYAREFLSDNEIDRHLESYKRGADILRGAGLAVHAGHGLTAESVMPLLRQGLFEEYNIGHWIICQAVFEGLGNVVRKLKTSFSQGHVDA